MNERERESLVAAGLVGVGGFVGAVSRYGLDVVGVAVGVAVGGEPLALGVAIAAIGFCGAFTGFSSFAVEVADRLNCDDHATAVWYASVTLATALLGVGAGVAAVSVVRLGWGPPPHSLEHRSAVDVCAHEHRERDCGE